MRSVSRLGLLKMLNLMTLAQAILLFFASPARSCRKRRKGSTVCFPVLPWNRAKIYYRRCENLFIMQGLKGRAFRYCGIKKPDFSMVEPDQQHHIRQGLNLFRPDRLIRLAPAFPLFIPAVCMIYCSG